MKYRVIRDNYGFKGGYWTAGQVVELAEHETPPAEHFEVVDGPVKGPEPIREVNTFSEMTELSAKQEAPAGFASSLKKSGRKK